MDRNEKNFVLLVDGKPARYFKDGQIKTYMTRDNAKKQAGVEYRRRVEYNERRAAWRAEGQNTPPLPVPTFSVGLFSAIDAEEVKFD